MSVLTPFIVIAASRPGAVIRAKPATEPGVHKLYWRTIKRVTVTGLGIYERLVRNHFLPGRVFERTQTQSTQA